LGHLDFGFLEDRESLPDESRSEESRKQDVEQTPVNTNLPIGGDIGTGSGQPNMSDHGDNDFGEMNPRI
jgi:hypothetical protein